MIEEILANIRKELIKSNKVLIIRMDSSEYQLYTLQDDEIWDDLYGTAPIMTGINLWFLLKDFQETL